MVRTGNNLTYVIRGGKHTSMYVQCMVYLDSTVYRAIGGYCTVDIQTHKHMTSYKYTKFIRTNYNSHS